MAALDIYGCGNWGICDYINKIKQYMTLKIIPFLSCVLWAHISKMLCEIREGQEAINGPMRLSNGVIALGTS